tara:strand:+ start:2952 stop:4478 length:1527 start_codon:yes stop_codon:yes gene_type:complete
MILETNLKLATLLTVEEGPKHALSIAKGIIKEVKAERELNNIHPQMHWDFYHSYQEKYFIKRKNEDKIQYDERVKSGKVVNYIRFIVDLDTRFLYGRPNKVGRRYGKNSKTSTRMRDINKLIKVDNLQMEAKRTASLFGEQGFRLIPVDKTTGSQVAINTKMDANVYPHPVPLDPRDTFFLLNPYGKVVAVVIESEFTDYVKDQLTKVTELIVDDSRWTWHDDALQKSGVNKYTIRDEFFLQKNNAQRIDTVQDMLVLQTTLNECLTDNAYFFARHGRPQLVSSVDLSNVIGKDNMVWQIDAQDEESIKVLDKLGFLVWEGKMEAAMEHLKELEAKLFKVSSTAAISTGDLKGIGNLRSGAALITAHSPSIQKALEQQIIWSENEEALAMAIASFDSIIHGEKVITRFPEFDFTIKFPTDTGVPGEELMVAEIRQLSMNSHLKTSKALIREDNPNFSDEEVEAYRTELIKDSEEIVDSKRAFETETKESGPSGGSSASKSTKQSKPKT